jgi:hypothetical protein
MNFCTNIENRLKRHYELQKLWHKKEYAFPHGAEANAPGRIHGQQAGGQVAAQSGTSCATGRS